MNSKNSLPSYQQLADLPLFRNIEEKLLHQILTNSYVTNFNKNYSLFHEGEKAQNFYIILEGWVKLYKNNLNGEELVLKMASTGQMVLITSLLISPVFMMNARIIEDSKIIVIPLEDIKTALKSNPQLADNIMIAAATQSQELFHHISELELKTTEERIALFLLNLFLENGKRLNSFKLPYDKSIIASYLGMKPETFSRSLRDLKNKDLIKVENDVITLANSFSLCGFCDLETAQKCSLHNTKECPNQEIL